MTNIVVAKIRKEKIFSKTEEVIYRSLTHKF